ncbi:hypothetical protein [Mechercharimyces sp. CAU 1602]|uniref:hypothetical protein n=1 Tax=Mechercharimyces sp. CAU 1602 TaxID=2973933 RepID=UPI0021618DB6|nr:hypothetical protein [Mechercharimyces sp. CAU 1602]MCS1351691.1 hypothetical protein [Mechercharimyces sp. CAU 1602]
MKKEPIIIKEYSGESDLLEAVTISLTQYVNGQLGEDILVIGERNKDTLPIKGLDSITFPD